MDVREARSVLGVGEADGWEVVRRSYRRRIRAAHPDTQKAGATTAAAAMLNEAYAVLSRAKRAGRLHVQVPTAAAAPAYTEHAEAAPPVVGVALVGDDTLLLAAPPDEAFPLLLEAGHRVGEVSYVDRSCSIFEVVVRQDGETCSLLVTTQGRAHGTEAFLTLEAMERPASLDPSRVVRRMLRALGGMLGA